MRPIQLNAYIVFTILFFLVRSTANAQVSGTYTSTPSICFNDGTVTVVPSGGTAPYTLSIISGPVYQNYPYPVILPAGVYQFQNVPKGTFTIQIQDAAGQTKQITATVGGTYTFPVITTPPTIILNDSIAVNVSGGMKPFQYAISSTSSFSGFGAYQQDSVFRNLCNGNYWVRVKDNCGNIYTQPIFLNSFIKVDVNCINFSTGAIDLVPPPDGTAPFTYTSKTAYTNLVTTSQSNVFTAVPAYGYLITITDACGRKDSFPYNTMDPQYRVPCPFSGSIEMANFSNSFFGPVVLTCTNCTPVQSVTLTTKPTEYNPFNIFSGLSPNTTYKIEAKDRCGNVLNKNIFTQGNLKMKQKFISCKSVEIQLLDDNNNIVTPTQVRLTATDSASIVFTSATGIFYGLPQIRPMKSTSWNVTATTGAGCSLPPTYLNTPYLGSYFYKYSMNAACEVSADWFSHTDVVDLVDILSVVSANGDTFREIPPTPQNVINFNDVPLNNATYVISDSGCALPYVFPYVYQKGNSLNATVQCGIGKKLLIRPRYVISDLSNSYASLTDSMIIALYDSAGNEVLKKETRFNVLYVEYDAPDTGWYTYKIFIKNKPSPYGMNAYDSICPLETGKIFITDKTIPFPLTTNLYKCPQDSPVTYSIYGGAIPYTVIIPGIDTFVQNSNTDVFPRQSPGQYTIIVYDDCGISRSMSFSVIDTCSLCVSVDTSAKGGTICTGDTVHLKNGYKGVATKHSWWLNGALYSNNADTIYVPLSGSSFTLKYVVANDSCSDSIVLNYTVKARPSLTLGNDTSYCANFSRVLTGASPSTIWSTGQTGSQITVSQAATYTALDSSGCTTVYDTIVIQQAAPPVFSLGNDTSICPGQTVVLNVPLSGATFNWSNGSTGSSITITDTVTRSVSVRVTKDGCTSADTISIGVLTIQNFSLGADTSFCDSVRYTLNSPTGGAVQWNDGSTGNTFGVSAPGTYWAEAVTACGTFRDSISVGLDTTPQFELVADRFFVCNSKDDSVLLKAVADSSGSAVIFSWNGGKKDSMVYVSELYVKQTGVYSTTASRGRCVALKDISLITDSCPVQVCKEGFAVPNVFTPNGDNVNDVFKVICPCDVEAFDMKIYNRWGQLVFLSNNIYEGWNGRYNNSLQNQETYMVIIDISTAQAKHQKMVSKLSLIQ